MYSTDAQQGTPQGKKGRLMQRFCRLGGVILVVSMVSIIVGIAAVAESGSLFPFNAGGALIAGIPALILAFCPFYMFYESSKTGDPGDENTCCFDCCIILMVVWFGITILLIPIGFGISGIYGVVACLDESEKAKVCEENADSKLALSIVTMVVTGILFILALALFFTCCCNASLFGMPLLNSYNSDTTTWSSYNTRTASQGYRSASTTAAQETAIQNALSGQRRADLRPRPATINDDNIEITITEPSAPHFAQGRDERTDIDSGTTLPSRDSANRYFDPPPSYEEVIRKESEIQFGV